MTLGLRQLHWAGWYRSLGAGPSILVATVWNKGLENFFFSFFLVKYQIENILGFLGHAVSVRLLSSALDNTQANVLFTKPGSEPNLACETVC